MGTIATSNRVIARDQMGLFVSLCDQAGANMMRDMANDGAELSRAMAPKGAKADPRTPHLADSITSRSSGNSAHWQADARHALAVEFGAAPHPITGYVSFFWQREGRYWKPGRNMISHPGNRSQPYLRPAYEVIMGRWMEYARKYYPR